MTAEDPAEPADNADLADPADDADPSRPAWRRRLPPFDRNGRLVIVGKCARSFGFGLLSVGIGLHFSAIGLDGATGGIVLGFALAGSMFLTLLIALLGDRVGRRRFLLIGSALMLLALLLPIAGDAPVLLALIAATGAIAATSTESSGLISADQAILPQTVPEGRRTDAFATYSLLSFAASATGTALLAPLIVIGDALGLDPRDRYVPAFIGYAIAGGVSLVTSWLIDARAEVPAEHRTTGFAIVHSRGIVARIAALFAYDAFSTSLILPAFMAFWFAEVHGFGPVEVSAIAFAIAVIGAASFPFAPRIARRVGLVNGMVITNVPSNLLLAILAIVPAGPIGTPAVVALYLARAFLSSMDVPLRQSYTMAVVHPGERTATAGITSLVRSGAQTAGPFMAGTLLLPFGLWVPVFLSGVLKMGYGVLLWLTFHDRPAPEEARSTVETGRADGGR